MQSKDAAVAGETVEARPGWAVNPAEEMALGATMAAEEMAHSCQASRQRSYLGKTAQAEQCEQLCSHTPQHRSIKSHPSCCTSSL